MVEAAVREAWARTRIRVWEEETSLLGLPTGACGAVFASLREPPAGFCSLVIEEAELSLAAPAAWARAQPWWPRVEAEIAGLTALTLDATLEPELIGYLAPAARRLAEAGIPVIPVGARRTDHLLVPAAQAAAAVAVLETWIRTCREPEN